ncbi:hypothetical protein MHM95_00490 [Pseudoalteromonas sp. CnMc7-15]|uniref:hypothetical protein n=1 Tax=unclassified Pseudoalteromonas TaxID=194690 RepID=UPI001EF61110|nr:hypothetical protein [Pseudoalteromonas sp. CnMc7-15]MCG7564774.1 hypothetical protein [Pseudoalteromonas sp. CnMc7-15]
MWFYVILAVVLIKTSLLGLGVVSMAIALCAWLLLRLGVVAIHPSMKQGFRRLFKVALLLHLSVYVALILKLLLIDSFDDIPAFIVGHLLIHHLMSAVIGATVIFMLIRRYFYYKGLHKSTS